MQQSLYILFLLIVALMTGCSGSSGPQMSDSEISAGQISTYQLKQQVSLYEKALEDPAIADSSQQRMELLKRLMDINDILQLDHRLMYYIDQLRDAAIENKDDAYCAMAEFMMGKRLHYHHDTIRGYQLCRKANDCYKL